MMCNFFPGLLVAIAFVFSSAVNAQVAQFGPGPVPSIPLTGGTMTGPLVIPSIPTVGNTGVGLQKWRKALANVRSGAGRAKVVILGDSTTMGAGSGSGGTLNENGAYVNAFPQQFAAQANTRVPTSAKSIFGDQAAAVAYGTYDSRVTLAAGWSQSVGSFGGLLFKYTSGAGTLSFTPTGPIDTLTIYYLRQNAQGSFQTNIDGGASLGTTSTAGTSLYTSVTYTVARGQHTINIVAQADGIIFLGGIVAYDSSIKAVDIIQAGSAGATTGTFTGTASIWSPQNVLAFLAPDLTIINLTINDSNSGTSLATYQANLQAIITTAQASGDVLLMVGPPSNTANATNGTLDQYINVLYVLAGSNNASVFNLKSRWVSYASANPIYPYFDNLHPGSSGYTDIANAIFTEIMAPFPTATANPVGIKVVPLTGGTVTFVVTQKVALIVPAGTLATLTVTLPACTAATDGDERSFSTTQIITSLTVNASSGSVAGAATSASVGAGHAYHCSGVDTTWYQMN